MKTESLTALLLSAVLTLSGFAVPVYAADTAPQMEKAEADAVTQEVSEIAGSQAEEIALEDSLEDALEEAIEDSENIHGRSLGEEAIESTETEEIVDDSTEAEETSADLTEVEESEARDTEEAETVIEEQVGSEETSSEALMDEETYIVASGEYGDNITWTLDSTGTQRISGTGALVAYTNDDYDTYTIIIENGITSIANTTLFQNAKNLNKVVLPESITSIDPYVFSYCRKLTTVELSEGITSIGLQAFFNCPRLKSINFPESLTSIGAQAFRDCSSLDHVEFPSNLEKIEGAAFEYTGLTDVTIPGSIKVLNGDVFCGCEKLVTATIEEGITSIGLTAFLNCGKLERVDIPVSVTSIGVMAFSGCTSLKDVYYADSRKSWNKINISSNGKKDLINDQVTIHYAKVEAVDVADLEISVNDAGLVYDGNAKTPALTINYDGEEVTEGVSISYENNTNAGNSTAKVIVTGDGENYEGTREIPFSIEKAKQIIACDTSEGVEQGKKQGYTVTGAQGTLTAQITDAALATAAVEGAKITITHVKAGITKLKVNAAETENYNAAEAEFDLFLLPGKTSRGDMFNLANNVKVTWKEVPGAKYYKVYRSGVKDPVIVTTGLVGWDKEPGLVNGQKYTYKIVASLTGKGDASGDSPLSYSKVMYRLKTVAIKSAKNTAPGKVTVKYDKTTAGDSYVLQYSTNQDMTGAKTKVVMGANTTTYVISGLAKGKTYYISIRVRKKVAGIDYYTTFGVAKKVTITK